VFEWSGRPDPRRPRAAGPGARPDERYTGHGGADRIARPAPRPGGARRTGPLDMFRYPASFRNGYRPAFRAAPAAGMREGGRVSERANAQRSTQREVS